MTTSIQPNKPITFTSRCSQVRDADWVCHKINQRFPHFSSTKMQPFIENFLKRNSEVLNYAKPAQNLSEIYFFLDDIIFPEGHQKVQDTVFAIKRMIRNFGEKRLQIDELIGTGEFKDNVYKTILMLQNKHANCTENAIMAELILKMNGIKNACCAILNKCSQNKKPESLDHMICVTNIDGSKFNGKITPKTIIVDPWLNRADFANRMELFFRNDCKNFFELNINESFNYVVREMVDISDDEIDDIKKILPELVFKTKNHKFMQK